jgi:hypothetical protein
VRCFHKTIVTVAKLQVLHILYVCVSARACVALVIQHEKRTSCTIFSSLSCMAPQYLSKQSHKRHDFRKNNYWIWNECFDFLYKFRQKKCFILRKIPQDIIIKAHTSSCEVSIVLSHFKQSSIFWTDFRNILKYQISWKLVQWEPSSYMQTDRRTDG